MITKEGLEKFLAELEALVQDRVFNADQKANEFKAPESYRTDMQGYSRGLHQQLFLEYCVYQDQCENTKRLAPLINTVAEALTKNIEGEGGPYARIKAVQMYLGTPPVEYFGEALSRLGFLDKKIIEEMVLIQPKGKIFGTLLMEQGLITRNREI